MDRRGGSAARRKERLLPPTRSPGREPGAFELLTARRDQGSANSRAGLYIPLRFGAAGPCVEMGDTGGRGNAGAAPHGWPRETKEVDMLRRIALPAVLTLVALLSASCAGPMYMGSNTYLGFSVGISNAAPPPRIVFVDEPDRAYVGSSV